MRVTAQKVAQLINDIDEDTPPQDGYPTFQPENIHYPALPDPVGYVYHVSPYAKEILAEGFIIDTGNSVLGGSFGSISTTNYENAIHYRDNIKLTVGVINGELSIKDVINTIGYESCMIGIDFLMSEIFRGENIPLSDVLPEKYMENYTRYEEKYNEEKQKYDALLNELKAKGRANVTKDELNALHNLYNELPSPLSDFLESSDASDWFLFLVENNLDFYGNILSEDQLEERNWRLLKAISMVAPIPLIAGNPILEHLKERKMSDVEIIECATAPVEYAEGKNTLHEEDPKGRFSYIPAELEWRFYDSTDLLPIRLVGTQIMRVTATSIIKAQTTQYMYHVMYLNNLQGIISEGLGSGSGQTFTTMESHSSGRLFITEESGVFFWNSRYEDWANHKSDNPAEEGYIPITLRFAYPDDELMIIDELGTNDSRHDSFYLEDGYISPDEIEVYDGTAWVALNIVDINSMENLVLETSTTETDEVDGEEIEYIWPDFDVFIP